MAGDYRVTLSPAALDDLFDIARYIADQRGVERGDAFLDTMLERADALARYPLRGSVPRELEDSGESEFRQLVSGPYRLIYSVVGEEVAVLLIADGRRDMAALLRDRLLGPRSSA